MISTRTYTSIIDNQGGNTLFEAIKSITADGHELWVASGYFSLDALNLLGDRLSQFDRVRLVFGSDAARPQRTALIEAMRNRSEADLLGQRDQDPVLAGLHRVREFIEAGKLEARVFMRDRFHAKAYLAHKSGHPPIAGILGSGNFTRSGLTENVELNAHLSIDQASQLETWFEAIWNEAVEDDITDEIKREIQRHIELYDPHSIYLRTLLTWGDWVQGRDPLLDSKIVPLLDPHQEDGFRQALNLVHREGGAMICDGVGLGKSYIALALIEHALSRGETVVLLAPRSILDASWQYYIKTFLQRYTKWFSSLQLRPITYFGFRPELTEDDFAKALAKGQPLTPHSENERELYEELEVLAEQAQWVIIDESHNLRRTNANRYVNVLRSLQTKDLGKKKVVLLTATPLNTDYQDVSAQLRLICLEGGKIGPLPLREIQAEAAAADRESRKDPERQLNLFSDEVPLLKSAMHTVAIQRSRATCKQLARDRGQTLRFPERDGLQQVYYDLSPLYGQLVKKTEHDFKELAEFIKAYREEVKRAAGAKQTQIRKGAVKIPKDGLRFSAYLPDRYRKVESESLRDAQVESFLVSLVFINVMKQLESSIAAFEGILRALGAGLCARLHYVFENEVAETLTEHLPWIQDKIRHLDADNELFEDDPGSLNEQDEEYLEQLKDRLHIHKGLADFGPETHDVRNWRAHIESDLRKLREIHELTLTAWHGGEDCKLTEIARQIQEQRQRGRKVLLFTQSVRTADYLYSMLQKLLPQERMERITAAIQGDRRRNILHAFSPRYNPINQGEFEFEELGLLISTDVLSEGVNLQEAGCILNYDLHWNPVRLIQRIGRVDRRLRDDDPGHSFSILNVMPPKEIEDIINLVGTVEGRKRKILKLLGLDQSFFSAADEEGTLEEFNRMVEGDLEPQDRALSSYVDAIANRAAEVEESDAAPAGAFGVWENAPESGFVGVFRVVLRENATPADREAFAQIEGRPILVLKTHRTSTDAPAILELLAKTEPKVHSADPSHLEDLPNQLKELKKVALGTIANRTVGVTAELVCWMELRSA